MVFVPIILPNPPQPTESQCKKMLEYANSLVDDMDTVIEQLNEISSEPDEALSLIIQKAKEMRSKATNVRTNLYTIRDTAKKKQYEVTPDFSGIY